MGRHRVIYQSEFPYSVTGRCINREWFSLPMESVWEIFCRELTKTAHDHDLKIHTFVLMSNHFHLIASTPRANISQCMQQFLKNTSSRLNHRGNRINETFAGRHYKCILHEPNYFLNAYKYNYRNPVNAGICQRVEDYPFSTLQMTLKKKPHIIPITEDSRFLSDGDGTLAWLNTPPTKEKQEAVRIALKRTYFKPKLGKDRRPALSASEKL